MVLGPAATAQAIALLDELCDQQLMSDSQIARRRHRVEFHEGILCLSRLIISLKGCFAETVSLRERRTMAECSICVCFKLNLSGLMLVEAALVHSEWVTLSYVSAAILLWLNWR